jgi:hypothetical protein
MHVTMMSLSKCVKQLDNLVQDLYLHVKIHYERDCWKKNMQELRVWAIEDIDLENVVASSDR